MDKGAADGCLPRAVDAVSGFRCACDTRTGSKTRIQQPSPPRAGGGGGPTTSESSGTRTRGSMWTDGSQAGPGCSTDESSYVNRCSLQSGHCVTEVRCLSRCGPYTTGQRNRHLGPGVYNRAARFRGIVHACGIAAKGLPMPMPQPLKGIAHGLHRETRHGAVPVGCQSVSRGWARRGAPVCSATTHRAVRHGCSAIRGEAASDGGKTARARKTRRRCTWRR